MRDHSPEVNGAGQEDGFMLLETIVALAISSSLVFLLISTLNGLSRSQERINVAVAAISQDIFDDTFVRTLFGGVKPGYYDDEVHFEGTRYKVSASTFVDDWSPPGGDQFTLEIEPGSQGQVILTLRERYSPLPGLGRGDFQFEYIDHFGRTTDSWNVDNRELVDIQVQRLAAFTTPVPRQVRIVRLSGSKREIMYALDLAAFDWPAPRQQDAAALAGAF